MSTTKQVLLLYVPEGITYPTSTTASKLSVDRKCTYCSLTAGLIHITQEMWWKTGQDFFQT
jgi:hypothetical protein